MNTSPQTSMLSNPFGDEPVPEGTLAYFRGRSRSRIYESVLREFLRSGISQATLARRMGKRAEQINRLLGAPGNWTLDTVSDLLFAISGAEPVYGVQYPLKEPPRNYRKPEWLITSGGMAAQTAADKYDLAKKGFTLSGASASSSIIPVFSVRSQ
jgi:hypothetical protein